MSSPGASQAIVRPDLRGAVVSEWDVNGEQANFIADRVGMRIDVPFASGTIKRIPREAMTEDPNTVKRGPDGSYTRGEWGDETFTYQTVEKGHEMPVDRNMAAQSKIYYDAELAAARIALSRVHRAHEILVAAAVMNTTTFTGSTLTTSVSTNWRTSASSATPIGDIKTARQNVRQNCGRDANTLIVDWVAWEALVETTQVLNRINGGATNSDPARARVAAVSELIQIPNIIIARSIKNTAKKGQNFSGSGIWDTTKAMVCYINPQPSLYDINLLNVYNWEGDGGSFDWTVESYYNEENRGDVIRARRQVGEKVEYSECGHLLTSVA